MAKITKYNVFCSTEQVWHEVWLPEGEEPTLCPVDGTHTIAPGRTVVMESLSDVQTEDPRTSDGKRIFLPNLFPGDVIIQYAGDGDDVTNGTRGGGQGFQISSAAVEEKSIEFQFIDWVYLAGGDISYEGAKIGDHVTYRVYAPASVGNSNPGAGDFNKVDVGGFNMFVPAPNEDGNWDMSLTEKLNANVAFTKVVPVPAPAGDGFFDWDPDTNAVTINALQKGGYNLFDVPLTISKFARKVRILGTNHFPLIVPAIKPKKILPHWKHEVKLNHVGATQLDLVFFIYTGRRNTT